MAKRILGEHGSSNTSFVRQTIETEHDYDAMPSDDLIIATAPVTITLPKHPYVGEVLQIVADVFKDSHDGKLHIRGGKYAINGGDIRLRKSSTVTLTFTVNREWVPSVERGPRGRRGEEGPRGHVGSTGATGPMGSAGLLQSKFVRREEPVTIPAATNTLATSAPLNITTSAGTFLEFSASFSFATANIGGVPNTKALFSIQEGGVDIATPPVSELIQASPDHASGSIVFRGAFPAGPHSFSLIVRTDLGPIDINPTVGGTAALSVLELTA